MSESKQDYAAAMERFLANGGKIQQIATNTSGRAEGSGYSAWGAPKKAGRKPAADTAAVDLDEDEDIS